MQTDYDKQAEDFLTKHGIKFRATLKDSKLPPWKEDGVRSGHHYRITLSKDRELSPIAAGAMSLCEDWVHQQKAKQTVQREAARITFDFWNSIADAEKLPEAEKALQNMQLQVQNTEPHLRINLRKLLQEAEQAVAELHPSAYDVLACISSDVHCPETFEDFCGEFGYESDSIKALQTFRRCSAFGKRLQEFFTAKEIEELSEIQ